jgi:hypothetical protein
VNKRWTVLIIGIWVLVSPWLLGFADISIMKWSNLVCGAAIILVSVWEIFGERSPEQKKGDREQKV